MDGWIKLSRKLLEHWIWDNEKYLKAWIYCLFRANFKDNKVLMDSRLVNLNKGEFITSINKFSRETGLTEQQVRTFWKLLENDKMINKQTTSKSTKIIICNYAIWQSEQQTDNKPATNQQQTSNKPATTDNKGKNKKNDKEEINIPSWDEFKEYALLKKYSVNVEALKLKYESWIEAGWKDGNNNKIINWKTKLLNTLPYLKEKEIGGSRVIQSENMPEGYGIPNPKAISFEEYKKQKERR